MYDKSVGEGRTRAKARRGQVWWTKALLPWWLAHAADSSRSASLYLLRKCL